MTAHVLVIDDDPVQRRLLKNAVERYGHLALLAENGKAGLELDPANFEESGKG